MFINRSTGQAKEITGAEYLSQAIADAILTDFNGTWGSEIFSSGSHDQKHQAATSNVSIIDTRITEAIERLKTIQTKDVFVTPEEKFESIRELMVFPFSDRGSFFFWLLVVNASKEQIEIGFEEIAELNHLIPIYFSDTEIKKTKSTV